MATMSQTRMRVLCLGNELMADDSFGFRVAERLQALSLDDLEVVTTLESGINLLDHVVDTPRLVVIDTVFTQKAAPGTIYRLQESDLEDVAGTAVHGMGFRDVLGLGRTLGLNVPGVIVFIAVEAADVLTVGGGMHPAVRAAIPLAVDMVLRLLDPGPSPAA
jgi:hydrogenase maturation protease